MAGAASDLLEVLAISNTAWLVLLTVQGTLIILLRNQISFASSLLLISEDILLLSHPYNVPELM